MTIKLVAILLIALVCTVAFRAVNAVAAAYEPAGCSAACVDRVKQRFVRQRERAEWREYKRYPMPYCTWGLESGPPRPGYGQWAPARYRVLNTAGSGAAGKFQIMARTWAAYGGTSYAPTADRARRLHQERVARRIAFAGTVRYAPQGLSAWVGC